MEFLSYSIERTFAKFQKEKKNNNKQFHGKGKTTQF